MALTRQRKKAAAVRGRLAAPAGTEGGGGFAEAAAEAAIEIGNLVEAATQPVGFDTTAYLAAYPDVVAAQVDPLAHFLQFGIHEGRSPFADGVWG